jgi:hypothetical protein
MRNQSNVSQPESVALSLTSTMGGSNFDMDSSQTDYTYLDRNNSHERVDSWNRQTESYANMNRFGDITVSKV